MKILNCFLDNRFGGPQQRAWTVARELRKYNIETIFLFNEKLKGCIPIAGFKGILIKYINFISRESPVRNFFLFCLFIPFNIYKLCKVIET